MDPSRLTHRWQETTATRSLMSCNSTGSRPIRRMSITLFSSAGTKVLLGSSISGGMNVWTAAGARTTSAIDGLR